MKRTALKRKTPLKRVSAKRRKLLRVVGPIRKDFLANAGQCMICRSATPVDVHEIARGFAREECLGQPILQLALCRACHAIAQDAPAAEQIAAKILWEIDLAVELYAGLRARRTVAREDVILRLAMPNLPEVKR